MAELLDSALKGAFRREGAHMQLIQDVVGERDAFPILVGPDERGRIANLARSMNAVGLRSRYRIWAGSAAVQVEQICVAWLGIGHNQLKVLTIAAHGGGRMLRQLKSQRVHAGSPHAKLYAPVCKGRRAIGQAPGSGLLH